MANERQSKKKLKLKFSSQAFRKMSARNAFPFQKLPVLNFSRSIAFKIHKTIFHYV